MVNLPAVTLLTRTGRCHTSTPHQPPYPLNNPSAFIDIMRHYVQTWPHHARAKDCFAHLGITTSWRSWNVKHFNLSPLTQERFPNPYWRIRMDHSDYTTGSTEQWRGKSSCRINSRTSKLLLGPLLCLPIGVKLSLWVTSVLKVQVLQLWQRSTSFTSPPHPPPVCFSSSRDEDDTPSSPAQAGWHISAKGQQKGAEIKVLGWGKKKKKIMQLKSYSIQIG